MFSRWLPCSNRAPGLEAGVLLVGDDWAEDHHDLELMDVGGATLARARLMRANGSCRFGRLGSGSRRQVSTGATGAVESFV